MRLESLALEDFRCFGSASIEPGPHLNVICGPNAAGKTSLLEAIYVLGRGRSFRATSNRALIRQGAEAFRIVATLGQGRSRQTLGLEGRPGDTRARAGGEKVVRRSVLAETLPAEVVDAAVHQLISGAPERRRRFLDRGMFHVKPSFLEHWRRYLKALRQRNAALRQEQPAKLVRGWDTEFVVAGEAISEDREAHSQALLDELDKLTPQLGLQDLAMGYKRGWKGDSLKAALDESWGRDSRLQSTQVGPHRADLTIHLAGAGTRERLSRGQEKLVGAGLLLAQTRLIGQQTGRAGVLLVDDPVADLDRHSLARLVAVIEGLDIQVFLAALDPDQLPLSLPVMMFHVEQGRLTPMV